MTKKYSKAKRFIYWD